MSFKPFDTCIAGQAFSMGVERTYSQVETPKYVSASYLIFHNLQAKLSRTAMQQP
jgi:hypothetical protein